MRFEVDANGHHHLVEARRGAHGWLVSFDGRQLAADVARTGERWSLLIGPAQGGADNAGPAEAGHYGRTFDSYDIAVESPGRLDRIVYVGGQAVRVSFAGSSALRRRNDQTATASGPSRVESPMAGRVVRLLVRAGEAVTAGQGLVVVEAMKMENELRATRAGTVTGIPVSVGGSIDAGTVLVIIE